MKHLIISVIVGLLLFSYIEVSTVPEPIESIKRNQAVQTLNIEEEATFKSSPINIEEQEDVKVGLLFYKGDNLSSARLKRTLEKSLNLGENFNTIYSSNSLETQLDMFNRMINENYKVIMMELTPESDTNYFIEEAKKSNIGLIFIGTEPDVRLLQSYEKVYYLGYNNFYFETAVAEEINKLYKDNIEYIDVVNDDETITYATVLSKESPEEFTDALQTSLEFYEVPINNPVNSQVKKYDYDLFKEIDQTIIKKCELILFDNSVELKRTIDYFNDPTEFKKLPKQKLVIMQYDDNTEKFLEDPSVIMAIGFDDAKLAELGSKLTMALAMDVNPTYEVIGVEPIDNKFYYIDYSVSTNLKPLN